MKVVLGLKLDPWHDTGAAIVVDDGSRLRVHAISQERLDRVKHSRAFPAQAIAYCLETVGCRLKDLNLVVSDFIMAPAVDDRAPWAAQPAPDAKQAFFQDINNLGIPTVFAEHHVCHAASAYYATDWDEAAVLVIDGLGSHYETQSIFSCRGNGITKVATSRKPGIGLMYNAVTELLLGFQHLQDGKTMGLAGHAKDSGIWTEYFTGKTDTQNPCQIVYDQFVDKGQLWKLTAPDHLPRRKPTDDPVSSPFPQYAYAAQSSLESSVMHLVRAAARMLPAKRLCYSGGVALNIPANRMILDSGLYQELFIQPAASDSGIPLGAALLGYYSVLGGTLRWKMHHAFLGREYTSSRTEAALTTWQGPCGEYCAESVARLLANDYLVAWSHGASEYGPRALGHRSILCSPRDPHMKAYLNREVKHREMFRPFAPIVPIENQAEYFDLRTPSPFMLINSQVNPDMAASIPAIVHADGTARVQSIHRNEQPELHALLNRMGEMTGVPVLLNTSLNLAGEPIVETPAEAVDLFARSRLDALVLEQRLLTKRPLIEMLAERNPGLISMHSSNMVTTNEQASGVSTDTGPSSGFTAEAENTALIKSKSASNLNILFYVEPLVDEQKDAFIRGSHYIITNIVDTLKKNPRFEINTLILANGSFKKGLEEPLKIHCKELSEELFLGYYRGAGSYEIIAKSFRNEHNKKALTYFAKKIGGITADFHPDVVITSVPVPFLRQLFPNTLTLHVEAGLLTSHPFSKSLFFDPVGLWSTSFIDRFATTIFESDLSPDQKNSVRRLKQAFCTMIESYNPFKNDLELLRNRYKKLILLSLPFVRDMKNDPGLDYATVEELASALLDKIDKNTGVLLTTHPEEKMVSDDTIKKIQHRFPNVAYLEKRQGYSASLYAMPFVDVVVNVCSKTALWSLFWDKKLLSIGKTFSGISDYSSLKDLELDEDLDSGRKDALLFYLLTNYFVPEKYYTNSDWLIHFLQTSVDKKKKHGIDTNFYDAIDADLTIIENAVRIIEGIMENAKEPGSSLPRGKDGLEFTGERFVPELDGQIAYEHFHRYAFASELAKEKTVLDIASGEGYGSAMLAKVAREVVGVDISDQAVNHAKQKYSNIGNLSFHLGECKSIPYQDGYFDVVISFETLEHTKDQSDFLSEIKRVLKKDGILVISTPNKKIYSDDKNYANPYHLLELNENDFLALLNSHFKHTHLWGQRLTFSSHLWPMYSTEAFRFKHYQLSPTRNYIKKNDPPFDAEYYIAACSDTAVMPENYISLYTGLRNELYTDYFKRYEWGKSLEMEIESKNNFIRALRNQIEHLKNPQDEGNGKETLAEEGLFTSNDVPKQNDTDLDVDSRYADAQILVQTGKIEEALSALTHIVQSRPGHAGAHHELGFLYYQKQDRVHALMHYERAVELDPQNSTPLRSLADFYYVEMGRAEEAQLLYSKILSIQPDDLEVLQILANICVSQKQLVAAHAVFAKILRLMPENTDARNAIEAINKYQRDTITQVTPEHLHKESVVLSNAGLFEESITLLKNLIEAHPDFALAHNDLGVLYGNGGDFQKAHEHYQQAVKLDPTNVTFQKNLADVTFIALGRVDEAIKMYSAILERVPDDQEARLALRQAQAKQGISESAVSSGDFSITLVQCPAWGRDTPPVAISLLGGNLRSNGFTVHLFDLNNELYHAVAAKHKMYWGQEHYSFWSSVTEVKDLTKQYRSSVESMVDRIVEKKSKLIGFSVVFTALHFTLEVAEMVKKRLPDSIIVLGGPSTAEYAHGLTHLERPFVDAIVLREGDITLPELCRVLREKGRLERMPGLVFKDNGEIINGGLREPAPSLDAIPYADYSEFDLAQYAHPYRLDMFSSRSCVNQCHYCDERKYLQRYRFRSGKSLFEEVRHNLSKFPGITYINFCDSVVNGSLKELGEFARLLVENNVQITWSGQSVVRKDMTPDFLKLLAKSGCTYLSYGVETGSDAVLKSMNKKLASREAAENNLRDTHNAGIKAYANFMFGYPTETEQDFLQTLDFIRRNRQWIDGVSPSQSFTVIVPNTLLFENPGKFGVEDNPHHLYWSTKDGKNTYPIRFGRYERFCRTCLELGLVGVGIVEEKVDKWKLLGAYYRFKKDYEKAIECYQKDLLKHGYSADSLASLQECCRKGEKFNPSEPLQGMERLISFYDERIKNLEHKSNGSDKSLLTHAAPSAPEPAKDASSDASAQQMHASALCKAQAGDDPGAIKDLECVVASFPGYAAAYNDLGVLLQKKGDFEGSQKYFEESIRFQPDNTTAQKNLADLYVVLGNFEEAARIYDHIISRFPNDIEALSGLGRLSIEIGQFDSARSFLQRILELDPGNADVRQCLDALQTRENEVPASPSPADEGASVNDNGKMIPAATHVQDVSLREQTEHDALLAIYQSVRNLLDPSNGKPNTKPNHSDAGLAALEESIQPSVHKGKYGKAAQQCVEVLIENRNNPRLLLLMGRLFHRAGSLQQAAFFFERAHALADGDQKILRPVEMFKRIVDVLPNSRTDIENLCEPDIILVQAPSWGVNTPPLGIAMLTSFARSRGYKVLPLDLNLEFYLNRPTEFRSAWELDQAQWFWKTRDCVDRMLNAFREKIDSFLDMIIAANARAVGFSVYNSSLYVSLELARMLKRRRPELTIIFGGPDVSRFASGPMIIKDQAVDAVAGGEGELILIDILDRMRKNRSLADCPGLLVRAGNTVIDTGERELVKDLDQVPAPDFTDYAFERYLTPTKLPILSSRGCPNQCVFCNDRPFWKRYRHRSAENVFAEIKTQLERYPFVNFLDFQDSLVNGNIGELARLADLIIESGLHVQWSGQAVIRKEMTPELMTKLKQSGCVCMAYGLETPSSSLMLKVGKVLSRGADVNAIAKAHAKTGLGVVYNVMFGLPGETEEDAFEALEFLRRNKDNGITVNPSAGFCLFGPASLVRDNPEKYGVDLSKGELFWESTDGENTYLRRLKRFEDFCRLAKELGISSTYPSSVLLDRNRALGSYYHHIGNMKRASQYYEAWLAEHPDDNDVRSRLSEMQSVDSNPASCTVEKEVIPVEKDKTSSLSPPPKGIICVNPFFEFEIDITGRVVVCCTGWFRHSLGNMKKQTIAEVWNSQVARYVRRKMYKGEWEDICNPHCPTIVHYRKYGTTIPYNELHKNKNMTPKLIEEILASKDHLESTPTYFKLSDSKVCNLSCKMCGVVRGKDFVDDKEMIQKRTKDIMQYLDRARTILLCGNGDPFARPDTRELLINYKNTNPDLKFCLITNGLLLPKYWEQVKHQNFESIDISVDAASKEVYEKIRVGGKWEHILNVLDLVRENKHRFGSVLISMVVMRSNFREIPAFIDMVESYGFYPMFSRIQGQFDDENIFEMRDVAALNELRTIVTAERMKKRTVDVIWQDIIEFADEQVEEGACLVSC